MNGIGIGIFLVIVLAGMAVLSFARGPWMDELVRLTQHKKKMQRKYHENEDEVNIFLTDQHTDFLSKKLALAGLQARYEEMRMRLIVVAVLTAVGFGVLAAFYMPEMTVPAFIAGLFFGVGGFIAYIGFLAKQRQAKIVEQLPQALETMVSALRAGSPIIEVFKVLADTASDPLRSEFKRASFHCNLVNHLEKQCMKCQPESIRLTLNCFRKRYLLARK